MLAVGAVALDNHRLGILLGGHDGDAAARAETMDEGLIGEDVELLHRFALHVLLTGAAEDVGQAGAADTVGDDLGGQGNAGKQPREFALACGASLRCSSWMCCWTVIRGSGSMPPILFLDGRISFHSISHSPP